MSSSEVQLFTVCPHCGGQLRYLYGTLAWHAIESFSFDPAAGHPQIAHGSFDDESNFESSDRYEPEYIECSKCFAALLSRPAGYASWSSVAVRSLPSLDVRLESLLRDLVVEVSTDAVISPERHELLAQAQRTLALAGVSIPSASDEPAAAETSPPSSDSVQTFQVTMLMSFTVSLEAADVEDAEDRAHAVAEEAAWRDWNGPYVAAVERV